MLRYLLYFLAGTHNTQLGDYTWGGNNSIFGGCGIPINSQSTSPVFGVSVFHFATEAVESL